MLFLERSPYNVSHLGIDGTIEFVSGNLGFLTRTYLALDVLGLVLVVVVLHAQLQLLDERFLRVLV